MRFRLIFVVLCLLTAIPAESNAQDAVVVELSLHEMIEGRAVRAIYIFLENFAYGEKGMALFDKADQLAKEYVMKKPLSDDPQKILNEFRKYAIGRRSWLDAKVLGDGYFAVRNKKNGWGVLMLDGSFIMQLGTFEDICGINREQRVFSAWKPGKNKCGIFTYDGQEVSEFIYSHVMVSRNGFAVATLASGCEQVLLIPEGSGKIVIPMKYNGMDRSTGKKFGHDPDYFMYLRARRSEGDKEYYDYYYARSLKLVHTCEK